MRQVKMFILVIVMVMFGAGCAMDNLQNSDEKSSTLTLNVNWDEAVANESTNKVIEDAITKGYKVYAGIIKSSEVDKSGTITFKEKQEISYRTNKKVVFTIQEADYTKYHVCIFIDKDGDGILSSWNNETIAYNYSLDVNSTSKTINMPIKITIVTSSSKLTFNVTWNQVVSTKGVEKSIIDEAISKGYKLYLGILKESEITKDEAVRCKIKQEIEYNKNREVIFNINEADYTKYQAYIYIDKNNNGVGDGISGELIAAVFDTITVNSTSQTINMPIYITPVTSSSKLTFNVTWNQVVSTKGVEKSIIDEAISKGYKLYLGILKESEITKDEAVRCKIKQEIEYNKNREVIFNINEADYTKYQAYIYIDKNNNGVGDGISGELIAAVFDTITVNSTSQTINMPIYITPVTSSSKLTFNVTWNQVVSTKGVEKSIIDEAISKGYKLYLGILKESEITKDEAVRCKIKQEIEYNKNREVIFTINEADYTKYQVYIYIDKNGNGFGDGVEGETIAGLLDTIAVNSTSQTIDFPVYINE